MGGRRPATVPKGKDRKSRRKRRHTREGGGTSLPPALASLTHAHPLLVSGEPLEPDGACAVGRRDPAVPHFPADAGQPPGCLHRSELHRGGAAGTPAPAWPGPAAARAVRRLPVKSGAWRVRPLLLQPRAGESEIGRASCRERV